MDSLTFASAQPRDWKALYRAAIHETDKTLLHEKISKAENAVLVRGRELLYEPGPLEEREQLDDALYALRAYRNAAVQLQKAA